MSIVNNTSIQVIKDLKEDLNRLSELKSNIEIIWALEELHNNKAFLKSAELIRKSMK